MAPRLVILMLFLAVSWHAFGEEKSRVSLAIMNIRANNTKDSYAEACVDILSEKLFSSGVFTIMEKSQMDRIARQNGFTEFNMVEPEQVARLGKKLKVDKMLSGSITHLDSYIIDIKVFNASTGEVEINVKKKIRSIEELEDAVDDIALTIERHTLGYYRLGGRFELTAEVHYLVPFGVFGKGLNPGTGIQIVTELNNPFEMPFNFEFITGFYSFSPANEAVEYFYMIPLFMTLSYRIPLTRNTRFIPSAGAGYFFSKVSTDKNSGTEGVYWDDRSYYYNPGLLLRGEFDILIHDRWYITVTPQYNIFFDRENAGQFLSIALGIKTLF